ncbi:pimeloyl-ACP methyl ester carboxylesterase [Pelomonas saccharophila]|uniref:Pimeloyl-ACP methyl ester carboxylesterase n=1 Tax=Roseateles saccharophilus TaxID=304 RepID=A0ABU1YQE5_ROSSA|nr:alpha/beta fold hydrolase [Roseateles saccharophilus]MDR7270958.1 pimeloyl-ACP methyl ester carboxylesterase [Roseateles saccharophilus]
MLKTLIPSFSLFRPSLAGLALCLSLVPALAASPSLEPVQGRPVEFLQAGPPRGAPVVVFENGARMTLDSWSAVVEALSRDATVLTHNRPGYGHSEAAEGPRSGEAVVEELRALLAAKGLKPPYVLVGHSLGGLYMQWFARRYPQEVQALVLVDSVYPRIIKKPEDFPWYARWGKRLLMSRAVSDEVDQIHATGEAVLALPAFDDSRVVQLFNVPKDKTAVAVDFGVVDDSPATIAFVKQLYPRARKHIVDSDHQIQTDKPELVVAAIREALTLRPQAGSSDSGR